jgi:hypothetical protein
VRVKFTRADCSGARCGRMRAVRRSRCGRQRPGSSRRGVRVRIQSPCRCAGGRHCRVWTDGRLRHQRVVDVFDEGLDLPSRRRLSVEPLERIEQVARSELRPEPGEGARPGDDCPGTGRSRSQGSRHTARVGRGEGALERPQVALVRAVDVATRPGWRVNGHVHGLLVHGIPDLARRHARAAERPGLLPCAA